VDPTLVIFFKFCGHNFEMRPLLPRIFNWPTCSCRTANRKSTLPRYHRDNFANYCRFIEVLLSINVKAVCLLVSSLTLLQTSS